MKQSKRPLNERPDWELRTGCFLFCAVSALLAWHLTPITYQFVDVLVQTDVADFSRADFIVGGVILIYLCFYWALFLFFEQNAAALRHLIVRRIAAR